MAGRAELADQAGSGEQCLHINPDTRLALDCTEEIQFVK